MGNMHTKEYRIRYYETDYDKRLKPTQWLNYFQDAAISHGEHVGRGLRFLDDNDLLWVLLEWDITIDRYPGYDERVTVNTMQHSSNGLYCKRLYNVKDEDGKTVASAVSIWMMLQKSTFKIIKVPEYILSAYGSRADRKNYQKTVKLIESPANAKTFVFPLHVCVSDLDSNNHVNNEKYLEWALREIPYDIYRQFEIRSIRVNYLKSAFYGDQLRVESNVEKVGEVITVKQSVKKHEGEPCCLIEFDMDKRQTEPSDNYRCFCLQS